VRGGASGVCMSGNGEIVLGEGDSRWRPLTYNTQNGSL
jgi:hypothetical protein